MALADDLADSRPSGGHWDDRVHRLTVDEYLRLAHDAEDRFERTELIDGVIYDMSPESLLHARTVRALFLALSEAFPDHEVLAWGSVQFGPHSLWQPDVFVTRPPPPDATYAAGDEVVLAVEVSLSSRTRDVGPKLRGYAAAGVAEYWVLVATTGGHLLRHTDPAGDGYRSVQRIDLPNGLADLDVAAVLAGGG